MAPKHFVCAIKTRLFIYVSKLCGVYEFQYTPEDPGPYSPNRREEKFSETGLPRRGVLGNWASGFWSSRKLTGLEGMKRGLGLYDQGTFARFFDLT